MANKITNIGQPERGLNVVSSIQVSACSEIMTFPLFLAI
jgi:hypothetical protein